MAKTNINESSEFKASFTDGRAPNGYAKRIPVFSEVPELPANMDKATQKQISDADALLVKLSKLEAKKEPHKEALKDIEEKQRPILSELNGLGKQVHQSVIALFKVGKLTEAFLVFRAGVRVIMCARKVTREVDLEALNEATLEFLASKNPTLATEVKTFQDTLRNGTPARVTDTYAQFEPAQGNK